MRFNKDNAEDLIQKGHLLQAALLDGEGMIIDAVGDEYDPEKMSAVFFALQNFATELERNLNLKETMEFSFRTNSLRLRLNIRHVPTEGTDLTLVCLTPIPNDHMPTLKELLEP